ncbi:MAG TPA: ATP-dependent DNA helicase RecG [Spirochaetota bacterium]|nr:ATP-dependent DNA helicase RecG [Spirochaetota bacterium]
MLDKSIQYIKGIGPKRAALLYNELGLETVEDLLYFLPRKYIDRSNTKSINNCFVNDFVTVMGIVKQVKISGHKKKFLEIVIDDGTDTLSGVFFGGIQYFIKLFEKGDTVLFSGRVDYYTNKQIVHPEYDFIGDSSDTLHTGRIVPIYPSTENLKTNGFNSRFFRKIIYTVLSEANQYITEPFDEDMLNRLQCMPLSQAIECIHFPSSMDEAYNARKRLAFNELFFLQYYLHLSRQYIRQTNKQNKPMINTATYHAFIKNLPFQLTGDQLQAIEEIINDLNADFPMNRMLQGDVGSGKTVVSLIASIAVVSRGQQVAFMAPTEILAQQHYATFKRLLPNTISVAVLTGSTSQAERKSILNGLNNSSIDVIIGTHALIQETVEFANLGFIIIDEQHRFGVNQRAQLRTKGAIPDLLVMTATPIPRSLSLTLYGDLDISIIKEKPANRIPITTLAFPVSKLEAVYRSLEKYMDEGRQVYYVLPLIDDSEKLDLKSATATFKQLQKRFPNKSIALLHGKLPNNDKEKIMSLFNNHALDMLVSTTVIEVGIDVANASIIVIEHAERFGLSQLHQLRGRVGRGTYKSFCILIYPDSITPESMQRINILTSTDDGFIIAEEDLKIRGAGEFIGTRQHGKGIAFEFADPINDFELISIAREEAKKKVESLQDIPALFENSKRLHTINILEGIRKKHILAMLS